MLSDDGVVGSRSYQMMVGLPADMLSDLHLLTDFGFVSVKD
jgi:hypothetical protein